MLILIEIGSCAYNREPIYAVHALSSIPTIKQRLHFLIDLRFKRLYEDDDKKLK